MSETFEQKTGSQSGPRKWTAEKNLRVVGAAHGLAAEELGALFRREGSRRKDKDAAHSALFLASFPSNALTGHSLVVSHFWRID